MKRSNVVTCLVVSFFVLFSMGGGLFAYQPCDAPCCQDAGEETCRSNQVINTDTEDECRHLRSSRCTDSGLESKNRRADPHLKCTSFCCHAHFGTFDCRCSLATQSDNYLPTSSSAILDLLPLQNCLVILAVLPQEGSSWSNYPFVKHTKAKESVPIFLQNASFLL